MVTNRRPILLLLLACWLICIAFLTRSWLWLWPLLILLTFREKHYWLLLLILIRLAFLPSASLTDYSGEAVFTPLSFSRVNQWQVEIQQEHYYYQGQLDTPGRYWVVVKRLPFRTHRLLSGFSEHDYYQAQGLVGRVDLIAYELEEVRPTPLRIRVQAALYERLVGFGETRDLAFALLFGGSRLLDDAFEQSLKEVGLLHLLVVSGLHLSIYERALEKLLGYVRLPRTIRRLLILLVLLALVTITDFHPSCIRSVGLFSLGEICFFLKQRIDRLDQLALVTCLMLLYNPYWASGTGFLLGAIAHGSLSFPTKPSLSKLYLIMLPFQLILNGYLSPLYLLTNILLAALMSLALPFLLITLMLQPLQVIGKLWLSGLVRLIGLVRDWELLQLEVMTPSPWVIAFVVTVYGLLLLSLQSGVLREAIKTYRYALYTLVILVIVSAQMLHVEQLKGVHFLQVGQGDAAMIITPSGKSVLIDTSKSPQVFEHLRYFGLHQLDLIIISHRDDDHAAYASELAFGVGYTSAETPLPGYLPLREGNYLNFDGVEFEVLHPKEDTANENDNSLVLRVKAYGDTFLFGGDVSGEFIEASWFEGVSVYKFPHHGSIHSLAGLEAEQNVPNIILSYGFNRYQHPHPEVVDYFSQSLVHHTYHTGSIQFRHGHFRVR